MDKLEVARRQLGAALDMHLKGLDPVSVHCLICGGSEIAEQLAINAGKAAFRDLTIESHPGMTKEQHRKIRNTYWNAFKHAERRGGQKRDDDDLMQTFSIADNNVRMFCGWLDYSQVGALPLEALIFKDWFLALDMSKFDPGANPAFIEYLNDEFPGLAAMSPDQQRTQLLLCIEKWKHHPGLMNSPSIDTRPLMLPWSNAAS